MTENERFTVTAYEFYDNGEPILGEDVCELLNELHEDNQLLDKMNADAIDFMYDNFDLNRMFTDRELNNICNEMGWELSEKGIKIDQLEKENEQLKHQLSQQEMEYVTDCHRLAEENMQLQEELDYYKTKCGSLETALLQGRRAVDKEKEQRMFFVDMEKQRKMFR